MNSFFDSQRREEFVDAAERVVEIEGIVEKLWGRDRRGKLLWPQHWSGMSIADRAKKFGPAYEQEYFEIYSLFCAYAHSGNSGYAYLSESALEGVYGISLKLARHMYLESLLIVTKLIPLSKAIDSFAEIIAYLKQASRHILVEYGLEKIKNQS